MKDDKSAARGSKRAETRPETPQTDMFTALIQSEFKTECVREYRFHPRRRWRFDYALPQYRLAIEIDGGVWLYGRHNRASGYLGDMEKMREAAAAGWLVLHFTPREQFTAKALDLIRRTIRTRFNEAQNG